MAHGAYILAPEGPVLGTREAAFFRDADPWGFILFARNIETPAQVLQLTTALRECVGRDAAILVDQEGGRVQRMRAPHWSEWVPPLDELALTGRAGLAARYRVIAAELRAVGIDVNCAPCADIANEDTHPFLRNRCYGGDVETVTIAAHAVADALLSGGVLPVIKHMPGHGRAVSDSHHEIPMVEADRDTLDQTDFAPFRALSHLPLGMTGHILFPEIDPSGPATTSPDVIRLIREAIGFTGFLMTDDISMEALSGTVVERSAAARAAGCDAVLHCNGKLDEMEQIAATAGLLDDAGMARGHAALNRRSADPGLDAAALLSEYRALERTRRHAR